jgi:hypothetical protein
MTGPAELWDLGPFGRTLEGPVFGQLDIVLSRVPAVAVRAAETELLMDVRGKALGRSPEGVFQLEVAFDTGIFLGREG